MATTKNLRELRAALKAVANPAKAVFLKKYFKTGPGEYAAGDKFLGIMVPESRKIAQKYHHLPLEEIRRLLHSETHEERLIALFILGMQFTNGDSAAKNIIFRFYLDNTRWINNWDLVDSSAPIIIGGYLVGRGSWGLLTQLALSKNIWERRIAMVATQAFIKQGQATPALEIAALLLEDTHDLIHKAAGWMLREVGEKCSVKELEDFLKQHYQTMPRTMLRYAIEKFSPEKRQAYLAGAI